MSARVLIDSPEIHLPATCTSKGFLCLCMNFRWTEPFFLMQQAHFSMILGDCYVIFLYITKVHFQATDWLVAYQVIECVIYYTDVMTLSPDLLFPIGSGPNWIMTQCGKEGSIFRITPREEQGWHTLHVPFFPCNFF